MKILFQPSHGKAARRLRGHRGWRPVHIFACLVALLVLPALGRAAPPEESGKALFVKQVWPAFQKHCHHCHGRQEPVNDLNLTTRDGMIRGGLRGGAMIPGDASSSLLVQAIELTDELQMPPSGPPLASEAVSAIRRWIDLGAPWFAEEPPADAKSSRPPKPDGDWAFRPLRRYAIPRHGLDRSRILTPVDAFLLQRMKAAGVEPAPRADRVTLIRRATLDLTGLPPTPGEVEAFLKDPAGDQTAFTDLVERLLASPRYGERWGRFWLGVVGYADLAGPAKALERPHAWRYRDYVIRSFQQDKRFDEFIVEQIAGQELESSPPEGRIATGFLRMGSWPRPDATASPQAWRDAATHRVGKVFLGLTIECARCHDHKSDPIAQADWNRLRSAFANTEPAEVRLDFLPQENSGALHETRDRWGEPIRRAQARTAGDGDGSRNKLDELWMKRHEPFVHSVTGGGGGAAVSSGAANLGRGGEAEPDGSAVRPAGSASQSLVPETAAGNRLALTKWIADPENPLTARVMVNRIWQHHFGAGLVATPNDLGAMGERPADRHLLDWLASRFSDRGWSVKEIHRLIMLSAAYQRVSRHPGGERVATLDPANELVSYYPARQMNLETFRDSVLAVSGELSTDTGGPGTFPQAYAAVAKGAPEAALPHDSSSPWKRERNRRSVYCFQPRPLENPSDVSFPAPPMSASCERLEPLPHANVGVQGLDQRFLFEAALAMAVRLQKVSDNPAERVEEAFRRALQRRPSEVERFVFLAVLKERTTHHERTPAEKLLLPLSDGAAGAEDSIGFERNIQPSEVPPEVRALADMVARLFRTEEFRTIR